MKVIIPATLSLISTDVPETEYTEWNSGTAYVVGDYCQKVGPHKIYKCTANNTNKDPETDVNTSTPSWVEVGSTNPYRMLDTKVTTPTSKDGSFTSRVGYSSMPDSLVLINTHAYQVTATQYDVNGNSLHTQTKVMQETSYSNWKDWFFGPERPIYDAVLPLYLFAGSTEITVAQAGPTISASCGMCVIGTTRDLGITQYNVKTGIRDYSKKSTDDFGNTYLKQGNFAKTFSVDVFVDSGNIDSLMLQLSDLRAVPAYFIGNNANSNFSALNVFGWISDFSIIVQGPSWSTLSIEITGLI